MFNLKRVVLTDKSLTNNGSQDSPFDENISRVINVLIDLNVVFFKAFFLFSFD